ncbi:guanine nucleotide-binding protein subunit alpha [Terramyces sp. JEL0728]|nr:guanine nucleotide-binding protein subunit alpha [Terramyces sp. JEL0728]
MIDAIVLFEQMIEHPLLKKQAFVIFFNKKDVYEKKVRKVNIIDFFPEYHGKPQSVSQGIKFFHSKFLANVKERKKYADLFKALSELDEEGSSALPPDVAEHIQNLWNEKELQETFAKIGQKMLPDTTEYFFNDISRFLNANYDPTNEDVLMLRTVTQHISCNVFQLDRTRLHMFDVSGLKHHRKQWIPYFDDVAAILYIVSLSSYDQTMVEDPTVNRMVDALVLFDQIVNNPALSKPDIILFFNKKDLYEKKVKKIPINEFFPEYQGFPR